MNFITIVAQNDGVNPAPSLVIGFSDDALHSQIFSVPTFSFSTGALTTVQIPISSWGPLIRRISPDGGSVRHCRSRRVHDDFRRSVLNASAIPEPGTFAALTGVLALGFAVWRRRCAVRS